eukprot:6078733-Karenia_brevis.AAC.1
MTFSRKIRILQQTIVQCLSAALNSADDVDDNENCNVVHQQPKSQNVLLASLFVCIFTTNPPAPPAPSPKDLAPPLPHTDLDLPVTICNADLGSD